MDFLCQRVCFIAEKQNNIGKNSPPLLKNIYICKKKEDNYDVINHIRFYICMFIFL